MVAKSSSRMRTRGCRRPGLPRRIGRARQDARPTPADRWYPACRSDSRGSRANGRRLAAAARVEETMHRVTRSRPAEHGGSASERGWTRKRRKALRKIVAAVQKHGAQLLAAPSHPPGRNSLLVELAAWVALGAWRHAIPVGVRDDRVGAAGALASAPLLVVSPACSDTSSARRARRPRRLVIVGIVRYVASSMRVPSRQLVCCRSSLPCCADRRTPRRKRGRSSSSRIPRNRATSRRWSLDGGARRGPSSTPLSLGLSSRTCVAELRSRSSASRSERAAGGTVATDGRLIARRTQDQARHGSPEW